MKRFCNLLLVLQGLACTTLWADSVVVFNEIMYHPATNEPALEWIEFHNQNSINVDLSGWRMTEGIDYTFPNGTTIRAGGYLVVAIAPETLAAQTGITNVVGPFTGRLSNNGEKLELRNLANRLMDSVSYAADGSWPAGADGSGVSLAKKAPNLASKPAASWTVSAQIGGDPGSANFSSSILTGGKTNYLGLASTWRFNDTGTDLGSAWRDPAYNDSSWPSGPGLFFVEDAALPGPKSTPLIPGRPTYYFRTTFSFDGNPATKLLSFRPVVDDGMVLYLNGSEVAQFNMPTGAVNYSTMASAALVDASLSPSISISSSNLVPGINTLAVELHQTAPSPTPAFAYPPRLASPSAGMVKMGTTSARPALPRLRPTRLSLRPGRRPLRAVTPIKRPSSMMGTMAQAFPGARQRTTPILTWFSGSTDSCLFPASPGVAIMETPTSHPAAAPAGTGRWAITPFNTRW